MKALAHSVPLVGLLLCFPLFVEGGSPRSPAASSWSPTGALLEVATTSNPAEGTVRVAALWGSDGRWHSPPDWENDVKVWESTRHVVLTGLLAPGTRLPVWRDGRIVGTVRVKTKQIEREKDIPIGVYGFWPINVSVASENVPREKAPLGEGAAVAGRLPIRLDVPPPARTLNEETARVLATQVMVTHGVSDRDLERLALRDLKTFSIRGGKGSAAFVSAWLPEDPHRCENTDSVNLIAERVHGSWEIRWQRFIDRADNEGCEDRSVTAVMRTSDGRDALLVNGFGYEWDWYEILVRSGDRWVRIYKGAGSGL